jgi:outer membrane lipoprotein carrier protein
MSQMFDKKRILLASAISLGAALMVFAASAFAQSQPSAKEIARLVQAFYDQTRVFEAEFEQSQYTRLYDRTENAKGKVVFKKPGKMRFDYEGPNGQVFVSDGRELKIYQPPEEGEERGQLIVRRIEEDQLPEVFAFLTGGGNLLQDFEVRLLDEARRDFPAGHVLELRPKRPTPHFERLVFYVTIVEQGGKRAGIIRRVLILDAAGNRNRFDFKKPRFDRDVSDRTFRYSPPRKTDVVRP